MISSASPSFKTYQRSFGNVTVLDHRDEARPKCQDSKAGCANFTLVEVGHNPVTEMYVTFTFLFIK